MHRSLSVLIIVLLSFPLMKAQEPDRERLLQQLSSDYMLNKNTVRSTRDELTSLASSSNKVVKEIARTHLQLAAQSKFIRALQIPAEYNQAILGLASLNYLLVSSKEKPTEEELREARELVRKRGRDYEKALNNPDKPLLSEIELLRLTKSIQEEQQALLRRLSTLASQGAAAPTKPTRNLFGTTVYMNKQGNKGLTQLINRTGKDLHQCLLIVTVHPGEETARIPLLPLFTRGALKEEAEGTKKALDYTKELSQVWREVGSMPQSFPVYLPTWPKGEALIFTLGDSPIIRFAKSASVSIWSPELTTENFNLEVYQYLVDTEAKKAVSSRLPPPPSVPGKKNNFGDYVKQRETAQTTRNEEALKPGSRWQGTQTVIYSANIDRMFDREGRGKKPTSPAKIDIVLNIAEREGKRFKGTISLAGQSYQYAGMIQGTVVVLVTEKKGIVQHFFQGAVDSRGQFTVKGHGTCVEGYTASGSAVLGK
jgi:hypothetical protein